MNSLRDWNSSSRGICSMSHMEKVLWKSEEISMSVRGMLNIPEVAVPPKLVPLLEQSVFQEDDSPSLDPGAMSPTLSIDSGRSTGTSLWPSSKYFVYGGPGFSIGILDSTTGSVDRLPIPFPTTILDPMDTSNNFSVCEVTSLVLAGESQLWAGTEAGSLHVFELSPGPRLTNHGYYKLPDPICCLKADKPFSLKYRSVTGRGKTKTVAKSEVLIGSTNGTLTVITGEVDEKGTLININKCPRKVVHLGDGCGCSRVQCIALVSMMGTENYWCGCGSRIVILHRSSWKVLARLDAMVGFPLSEDSSPLSSDEDDEQGEWLDLQVHCLEPTEHGVWSSMEHSAAAVLWDTKRFEPKLKISCFQSRPETPLVNHQAVVTALAFLDDLLFVGTQGGYLMIFNIRHKTGHSRTRNSSSLSTNKPTMSLPPSPKLTSAGKLRKFSADVDYTLVGATCCCSQPVMCIHPYGPITSLHSPTSTPASASLNILVLASNGAGSLHSSQSTIHLYEVTGGSPVESPLSSPQGGLRSGRVSATSSKSLPTGPLRKCSLTDLENLPELTLHRVSKGAVSYLPLQGKSS